MKKYIQVIDSAPNCVYDIFETDEQSFEQLFPNGTDIAFIEDYPEGDEKIGALLSKLWRNRVKKTEANGVHGILFYELYEKKAFYPSLKDEEAINPNGSRLRASGAWREIDNDCDL